MDLAHVTELLTLLFSYALQWLVTLPLELVAASITISFWNETVSPAVFVTVFLILIMAINLFGVKGYGEAEFMFSMIKVVAVIGFM
jgi:amino acid transporter